MQKTVVILQSNYAPWKGYFDLINRADEFILYDDVQYTRRDWRNRNRIKTPHGLMWLTIPIDVKGKYHQLIHEAQVKYAGWAEEHWKSIQQNYAKSNCFSEYAPIFEALYQSPDVATEKFLSKINYVFITKICNLLGINTKISWSSDYDLEGDKTERLASLCAQAGATHYLSGPAAKAYMQPEVFEAANIELTYMDYAGYPEYRQKFLPFEHGVSIIDLIFNEGKNTPQFMISFQ